MRLIDADAVEKQAYDDVHYHAELEDWEFDVVTHYLDHAQTIDAVPVVRCKDCKWFAECVGKDSGKPCGYGQCTRPLCMRSLIGTDDFCSCGERKDGEG